MDPSDRLLTGVESAPSGEIEENLLLKPKPSGVKCDIVNECQMFLKAEDGGGDTHLNIKELPKQDINGMFLFTHSLVYINFCLHLFKQMINLCQIPI